MDYEIITEFDCKQFDLDNDGDENIKLKQKDNILILSVNDMDITVFTGAANWLSYYIKIYYKYIDGEFKPVKYKLEPLNP